MKVVTLHCGEQKRDVHNFEYFTMCTVHAYLKHRNIGATLEEACFKNGESFSAYFHPILRTVARFCKPLKNCSYEVNYLADQPIFDRVFPQKCLQD
jgi:hypothetical protein